MGKNSDGVGPSVAEIFTDRIGQTGSFQKLLRSMNVDCAEYLSLSECWPQFKPMGEGLTTFVDPTLQTSVVQRRFTIQSEAGMATQLQRGTLMLLDSPVLSC